MESNSGGEEVKVALSTQPATLWIVIRPFHFYLGHAIRHKGEQLAGRENPPLRRKGTLLQGLQQDRRERRMLSTPQGVGSDLTGPRRGDHLERGMTKQLGLEAVMHARATADFEIEDLARMTAIEDHQLVPCVAEILEIAK